MIQEGLLMSGLTADDDEAFFFFCSKKKKFFGIGALPSGSPALSLVSTQPRMKHDFFLEGIIKYSQKHQKQIS